MSTDRDFMKIAIEEARKSNPGDRRIHPLVGAVITKDGKILAKAHRGELADGQHAEFTALEQKLQDEILAGTTVYTTLEPCTSRNHPKVPCAERLIERRVARVVIGIVDPNPAISGKGIRRLREAGISTDLFPADLMSEIEDLNRDFIRYQKQQDERPTVSAEKVDELTRRTLDDWYRILNRTFWNKNFQCDPSVIFAHLVEVIGGLSAVASNKQKASSSPDSYIVKAIGWWLTLCGKLGVRSVEDMLWDKFPSVCPYCHKVPHNPDTCSERKAACSGPQWEVLASIGQMKGNRGRPKQLSEWQLMFSQVYPVQQTEEFGPSFARLAEELGELAEAVRVFRAEPGYVLSEAADVFAWLMHIQNIIDSKAMVSSAKRGEALGIAFAKAYAEGCKACNKRLCACPPILPSTIGRIAHEVPTNRSSYTEDGRFMSPDKASKFFQDA